MISPRPLFGSWLLGGFECSAHKRGDGVRLDVITATGHDMRAADDYRLLQSHGMQAARDGLRWHRIEERPGRYDWSSFRPMLHAARDTGTTVIWDLLHYGVPNGVDVFSPRFVTRFAAFARAVAEMVRAETDAPPLWTPINEISFWAWAGGDTGGLNPFARGRGGEMKRQLVRAFLAAAAELRAVDPRARILTAEPLIHIFPKSREPVDIDLAAAHNRGQHEAHDLLLGRIEPEIGGHAGAVDVIGLNYYYNNQWIDEGRPVVGGDWLHRPLHHLLGEVAARYSMPLYIAETGTEGVFRPYWLRYVVDEARAALAAGVPLGGVCLYPVLSHPGWNDDRACSNGVWDAHGPACERRAPPLLLATLAEMVAGFDPAGITPPAAPSPR